MPRTPSTALNDFVPALAGIADIPANAITAVTAVGIPILVVAGLTPRWRWRALITVTIVVLVAAIAWAFQPARDVDPARLALLIASIVIVMVAIVVWGARSAWAWFVARRGVWPGVASTQRGRAHCSRRDGVDRARRPPRCIGVYTRRADCSSRREPTLGVV